MSRPVATLLLVLCTALWGLAFTAQKSAMDYMGPLTFSGTRFIIGALIVLPFVLLENRRRPAPLTPGQRGLTIIMCAVFAIGSILQQYGLTLTTVTNSGFLTGLYVIFVPFIALVFLRVRLAPVVWVGMPVAILGLYLLNGGGLDRLNAGDLLVIVSAVFWAMHIMTLGILATATNRPILLSAVTFASAGLICIGLAFVFETPSLAAISLGWVEIAYAGVLSTGLAFTLQAIGQQHVPAANAAIILSAESLFAALGGALILGERLPAIGYLGAALIFLAIIIVEAVPIWRERRRLAMV